MKYMARYYIGRGGYGPGNGRPDRLHFGIGWPDRDGDAHAEVAAVAGIGVLGFRFQVSFGYFRAWCSFTRRQT